MARLTIEQKMQKLKDEMKALRLKKKAAEMKVKAVKTVKPELTKESPGIQSLLEHFEEVSKQNNVKNAELIKLVNRLKRTGLKIEDRKPRSSKPE